MKVYVRGKAPVSLDKRDFIAGGGEGAVYGKGDVAFKIYADPDRMIPEAKMRELQGLTHPRLVVPREPVLDVRNRPIGYTMTWVRNAEPLCRLFTTDFQQRRGVTPQVAARLVAAMREVFVEVHGAGCLLVDANEGNFLVDAADLTRPWFIDVDSYQTPSYPATAILPAVRDPLAATFTVLSDWFSFGVVACQIFVGIHPFRGRHPDFKAGDLEGRMKAHVSIFNARVTLPPSARDLGLIPSAYRDWFEELFERGRRLPPPDGAVLVSGAKVFGTTVGGANPASPGLMPSSPLSPPPSKDRITITELVRLDGSLIWHRFVAGKRILATADAIFIDGCRHPHPAGTEVALSPVALSPVFLRLENGLLRLESPERRLIPHPAFRADGLMVTGNTPYLLHDGRFSEIALTEVGPSLAVSVRRSWDVMPHATRLFDGVAVERMLDRTVLLIPCPGPGDAGGCATVTVPELDGMTILEARHDNGVVMGVALAAGKYKRWRLVFDAAWRRYDVRISDAPGMAAPNLTVLDKGVAVAILEDGAIEIFANRPDQPQVRRLSDPRVATLRLSREGNTVCALKGDRLVALRLG